MKGTQSFRDTIKAYLDNRANEDSIFAVSYAKESKNIDDCITYILNEVKKSGCCGFADNEIYSLAVHYYDEDDITIGSPINCRVVVNHNVELTEEEKKEAHRKAVEQYQQEEIKKMRDRNSKPKAKVESTALPSLFD